MNGINIYYIILIVVALGGAAYLYIKHRKATAASSNASAPAATSVAAKIDAAVVDLKTHVETTVANAADAIKARVATVGAATVSKITGQPVGVPVAGTANAPAPAPAAPASPSVTSEPPPAPVAATQQPAAGGSGTTPAVDPAAQASDQFYAAAVAAKAVQQQNEAYNGPVPASSLQEADWKFLWWATINPATPKMHNWEYVVLSGTRAEIQQGLAHIGNDVARMRGYDATKYTGVLRAPYDAAIKA